MTSIRIALISAVASLLLAGPLAAQGTTTPAPAFEPQSGQAGKDVVWVPTHQALVDRMLDMAELKPDDYVIDLGSGDGRTVISAAKRGHRALGVEYNPDMVALSRRNAENEGVAGKARFVEGDIFETDFSEADVLMLFLLPELNVRLRPTILKMKPGTRVVSNSFDMEEWQPDQTQQAEGECRSFCRAFKWIVPAQVAGVWRLPDGELHLQQRFQMLTGQLRSGGTAHAITDAKMIGAEIVFTAGGRRYSGRLDGGRIEGRSEPMSGTGSQGWSAVRSNS